MLTSSTQGQLIQLTGYSLDCDNLITAHGSTRPTDTLPASKRAWWQQGEVPRGKVTPHSHDTHLVIGRFVVGTLLLTVAGKVPLCFRPLWGNEFSIYAALRILRVKGFISP